MLVTLIYHRKLDADWEAAAKALADRLNIKIMGRSRGQKVIIGDDYVVEQLQVHGRTFKYKQIESSFTQPNAIVCQKMLTWACHTIQGKNKDLLELYCGNGNFTLPLSLHFNRVLATELAKVLFMLRSGILHKTRLITSKLPDFRPKSLLKPIAVNVVSDAYKKHKSSLMAINLIRFCRSTTRRN